MKHYKILGLKKLHPVCKENNWIELYEKSFDNDEDRDIWFKDFNEARDGIYKFVQIEKRTVNVESL